MNATTIPATPGGLWGRTVTTLSCVACGCSTRILDVAARDRMEHRCPTPVTGPVWVLTGPLLPPPARDAGRP